ncbi:MAG: competence/damage-inducible protein A [Lachnospiraceae bacterium]|nr:competence/damage-inducible protein A [Lachnospiraceae bacterium]
MIAELISVGTEILLGNIVNTNAAYLSEKLAVLGYSVYFQTTVGDNEERLAMAISAALSRSDVVILSGGLGPTEDDLTKETAAKVLGIECYEDKQVKEAITTYFNKRKAKEVTENNWKQAMVPEGARILFNENGTAPGLILDTKEEKHLILLPGPPGELKPMFENQVMKYLGEINPGTIYSQMVKIHGVGESAVETIVKDLIDGQNNPTVAPYAKTGEVHLRVTARADTKKEAKKLVQPVCAEIKSRFGNAVYTTDEKETLEESIVKLLKKHDLTLATAESCTGGLLAGRLVNVPGVSDVFQQGFVTYSNKAKRKLLDVSKSTLKKYGAVSKQTAKEMAAGAAILTGADVAVSITGLAGPDGATKEKPVGMVCMSCYIKEKNFTKEYNFTGNRQKIRENSVVYALSLLRHSILENYETKK